MDNTTKALPGEAFTLFQSSPVSHISEAEALCNQRRKYYPSLDGGKVLAEVCTFSADRFNPLGLEIERARHCLRVEDPDVGEAQSGNIAALNRAKKRAFDLIACNPDCNLFVTMTLDASVISRTEWAEIISAMNVWLDNMVRRHGLKYVLVPEHHADGKAIHFHGIMNEAGLRLVDSGHRHRGKVVYNLPQWRYGFTTAKRIGRTETDHIKVTKYIFKYMTKAGKILREDPAADVRIGGRYFLHGGALVEPTYEYFRADYEAADGFGVCISDFLSCKIKTYL